MKAETKDYLLPTKAELVFYFSLSIFVLFVANFNYLRVYLLYSGADTDVSTNVFSQYFSQLVQIVNGTPYLPEGTVFIFWSLVGLVVYSIIQAMYNVYHSAKENVQIATHFLHPTNYTNARFWGEIALQFIAHVSLYALTVLWFVVFFYVLIPIGSVVVRHFLEAASIGSFLNFIGSFVLLYIGVVTLFLVLKLFIKRKQLLI